MYKSAPRDLHRRHGWHGRYRRHCCLGGGFRRRRSSVGQTTQLAARQPFRLAGTHLHSLRRTAFRRFFRLFDNLRHFKASNRSTALTVCPFSAYMASRSNSTSRRRWPGEDRSAATGHRRYQDRLRPFSFIEAPLFVVALAAAYNIVLGLCVCDIEERRR